MTRDSERYLHYTKPDAWPDYDQERLSKVRNALTNMAFGTVFLAMFEYDYELSQTIKDTTKAVLAGEISMLATFSAVAALQSRRENFVERFETNAVGEIEQTEAWQELTWVADVIDPPTED